MAPSRHDWKIVDWDVKPQHNQPTLFDLYQSLDRLPVEIRKIAVCFLWLSLLGDCRVTDEALLAETT